MKLHEHPTARLIWCVAGAASGIEVALALSGPPLAPFLLASLGGSSVFLFGLTHAPAAQPRSLFGGHIGCAFMGILCYQAFGDSLWVFALAQALALCFMLLTKTLHPPAGANSILMVYTHATWTALLQPVLLSVACLAVVAFLWSRIYPGLCHYPVAWLEGSPQGTLWVGWKEN